MAITSAVFGRVAIEISWQSMFGSSHVLATVTWDLLDRGLEVIVTWRESYLLVDDGASLQVRSSIDHRP